MYVVVVRMLPFILLMVLLLVGWVFLKLGVEQLNVITGGVPAQYGDAIWYYFCYNSVLKVNFWWGRVNFFLN